MLTPLRQKPSYNRHMASADFFAPGQRPYTDREEILHALTHGIAVPVAVLGLVLLLLRADGVAQQSAAAVYGASVVIVYLASTLYHALHRTVWHRTFRTLDHVAIYLKIAGTYTPLTLLVLPGATGIGLLSVIWLLAAAGIAIKLARHGRPDTAAADRLSLWFYLGMGWLGVVLIGPLWAALGPAEFALLIAGGVLYSAGAAVYARQSMIYNHLAWHLFVIAGSTCHFVLVWMLLGAPVPELVAEGMPPMVNGLVDGLRDGLTR